MAEVVKMRVNFKKELLELLKAEVVMSITISLGMLLLAPVFLIVFGENISSNFFNMFLYLFFLYGIPCIKVGILIPLVLICCVMLKKRIKRLAAR